METSVTKPRLLLADDSVTIRKVVEMTFADEGIDVWAVGDGESAMMKFVEIQPDIVLVDADLPGTNGYEICDMIKRDEATEHIPVLLLVGSFEPFDPEDAKRVSANGFLTKPFQSLRELVACVKDFLAQNPPPPAAVTPETEDIEDLYRNSFSRTGEVEEFTAVDDYLAPEALDDQMIETFSIADSVESNGGEAAVVKAPEPETQVKEFDWSPTSIVTQGAAAEPAKVANGPKFTFDDDVPAEPAVDPFSETVSVQPQAVAAEPAKPEPQGSGFVEPSAEFIALVAERVVERLSDRVIREIALETVPKIAEKMIREALEPDKKE